MGIFVILVGLMVVLDGEIGYEIIFYKYSSTPQGKRIWKTYFIRKKKEPTNYTNFTNYCSVLNKFV